MGIDKRLIWQPLFGTASPWHWWFAWYPIRTWDGRFVWLRRVERRLVQKNSWYDGPDWTWYQYHYDKGYIGE